MYDLKPKSVHALDTVLDDPDACARIERIVAALGASMNDVDVFTEKRIPDVARRVAQPPAEPMPGVPYQHRQSLVFTRMRIDDADAPEPFDGADLDDDVKKAARQIDGRFPRVRNTHAPDSDAAANLVCWNTQDFGLVTGCPHGCRYCWAGRDWHVTTFAANVNEYVEKVVGPTIEKHPGQTCFRLIGWGTDLATFEPEYGAFETFLSKLAEYPDRYGYFHTAGDNVDWIERVPHRDRLIGVWSLPCDASAEYIEAGAPSAAARIEAARRCAGWGVPVRFKFKPTIPVKGWREEYAAVIRRIFDTVRPESIGFCVLMWMTFEDMAGMFDPDRLDPQFVAAAEAAKEELKDVRTGPFPHAVRAEVYRFFIEEIRKYDKTIPLYVSTESREMWDELKDELGQNPRTFICGCNPIEGPGPRMMPSEALDRSTYGVE